MDNKSGKAMQKYYKDVAKNLDAMTPWVSHVTRRLARTRGGKKLEPGVLSVDLDGAEAQLEIFKKFNN